MTIDLPDTTNLTPVPRSSARYLYFSVLSLLLLGFGLYQIIFFVDEIDANCGRMRRRMLIGPLSVYSNSYDTDFSRLVVADGPSGSPNWKRVNTFRCFDRHSPHHSYHGIPHDLQTLMMAAEWRGLTEPEQRQLALKAIPHLRSGNWRDRTAIQQMAQDLIQPVSP